MTAESNARDHAENFRWWLGTPDLTDYEARRRDLLALRSAVNDLLRELATRRARLGMNRERHCVPELRVADSPLVRT